jgi:hypothetical protein
LNTFAMNSPRGTAKRVNTHRNNRMGSKSLMVILIS